MDRLLSGHSDLIGGEFRLVPAPGHWEAHASVVKTCLVSTARASAQWLCETTLRPTGCDPMSTKYEAILSGNGQARHRLRSGSQAPECKSRSSSPSATAATVST